MNRSCRRLMVLSLLGLSVFISGQGGGCPVDKDGDWIPDTIDNCPDTWNPDQADENGDGIGDACAFTPERHVYTLAVSGSYVLLGWSGRDARGDDLSGIEVIDVLDPSAPLWVGGCLAPRGGSMTGDMCVSGKYLYATGTRRNLEYPSVDAYVAVIDISNPASPVYLGDCNTGPTFPAGVDLSGKYAYVANLEWGLRVVDVSDPTAPANFGYYRDDQTTFQDIAIAGPYAYTAWSGYDQQFDQIGGVAVFDFSNPAAPVLVGKNQIDQFAGRITLADHYAYLLAGQEGNASLRTVDVSNPAAPVQVGYYDMRPRAAAGVAVSGNYAYVVCFGWDGQGYRTAGVDVIDISNPDSPAHTGGYDLGKLDWDITANSIIIANDMAWTKRLRRRMGGVASWRGDDRG